MYQRESQMYHSNPYRPTHPPQINPYDQQMMQYNSPYPVAPSPPPSPTPFSQFAKPAQPQNWPAFMQQNPNFFPPQQQNVQQPSNGLMNYFQDQNGQVDYGKMLNTVSQVASTVQQVSPVIQQLSSVIKSFR